MICIQQKANILKSTNVVNTNNTYSSATTYIFGEVIEFGKYLYKSLIDDNLDNQPDINSDSWLVWGVSNEKALIDLRSTTSTVWDSSTASEILDNALIFEVQNNSYTHLGLGNIHGISTIVTIHNNSDDSLVWSGDIFIYEEDVPGNDLVALPLHVDTFIRVTIVARDATCSVGYAIFGNSEFLGDSLYGINFDMIDNSSIQTDEFGITTVTKRTSSNRIDIDVIMDVSNFGAIKNRVRKIYGEIVLFAGDEKPNSKFDNLLLLGLVEDFNPVIKNATKVEASFSLKEVI